ncbi:ABC transporter permease [Cellulomonas soli]|uniref:Transport permease protein n=1 Tax=Cellulomonas soli TaxID=931535 RepID=A0A512PHP6_9CELL|nr:ABC transporter permease [Cellulomonas soli]NYI59235.1 ABC-2 type transport system permease protein [Cellulomonas soli]GEP70741.1 transport permease protein [Cellulomonas soli]
MPARPTSALRRLTLTEGRLFLRDPSALFFALLFPALLLTVLGLVMPWADLPFDETDPELAGVTWITGFTPIMLVLAIATVSFTTFPTLVATYRQRGVLRRMSTTPVPPWKLLVAQVLVNLAALLVACLFALALAVGVLDVGLPAQPATFVLAFVLTVLGTFAIGAVIAAVAPTTSAATGFGMTAYFVSLLLGGVWVPLQVMPEGLRRVAELTPVGAGSQAMTAAWLAQPFPTSSMVVMAVWALVGIPLAARLFRWT